MSPAQLSRRGQPHETLALIELETGHPQEAQREARAGLALDPTGPRTMGEAGYVLAATGDTERAQQLLAILKDLWRKGSAFSALPAMVEIGLGEREQAVVLLQQGMERTPGPGPRAFAQWHAFDALAGNARYQALGAQTAKPPTLNPTESDAN